MLTQFVLRRHQPHDAVAEYFYEIVQQSRDSPVFPWQDRHLALVHSERAGMAIVAALNAQRKEGLAEGITRYAWWNSGKQFVGTCGTTLAVALEELQRE